MNKKLILSFIFLIFGLSFVWAGTPVTDSLSITLDQGASQNNNLEQGMVVEPLTNITNVIITKHSADTSDTCNIYSDAGVTLVDSCSFSGDNCSLTNTTQLNESNYYWFACGSSGTFTRRFYSDGAYLPETDNNIRWNASFNNFATLRDYQAFTIESITSTNISIGNEITLNELKANNETFVNESFFSVQDILWELNLSVPEGSSNPNTTAYVYNGTGDLIYNETVNNNLTPSFNVTGLIDSGQNYNISFYSINNATNETFGNYSFIVDLNPPIINNSLPSELIVDLDYNVNVSEYVTCDEIGGGYCNITFEPDGTDIAVNTTSYNFTNNGNQSYIITAFDDAGNNVTENGTVLINPRAYFSFNESGTLLQNFTLGGTTFTNQEYANFTLYGSTINGLGNKTLEWSKFGYITQNISFEVTNTSKINNTYNVSQSVINVTIYDKFTGDKITGENFTLELIGSVSATTSTITGNALISNLLFLNEEYQLIVGNGDYSTESVYFTFNNQEQLELSVYVQNTSDPLYGTVVIEGTFFSGAPAIGKIVQALQWNSNTSTYIPVSQGVTDTSGKSTLNIILDDKLYKFKIIDGTNSAESPAETITSDETGKTVSLTLPDTTTSIQYFLQGVTASATEVYNNLTNTSTVTASWTNIYGTDLTVCINLYKVVNFKERLDTVSCGTPASSGTYFKAYTLNSSEDVNIKAEILINGEYYLIDNFRHNSIFSLGEVLKQYGLDIFVLLLLFGLSIWFGLFVLENIYISGILIIFSSFLGYFVTSSFITTSIASGIAIMALLSLWGGYTRK